MDQLTIQRLGQIRHDEIVAQSNFEDAPPRPWLLRRLFSRMAQQAGNALRRINLTERQPDTLYTDSSEAKFRA